MPPAYFAWLGSAGSHVACPSIGVNQADIVSVTLDWQHALPWFRAWAAFGKADFVIIRAVPAKDPGVCWPICGRQCTPSRISSYQGPACEIRLSSMPDHSDPIQRRPLQTRSRRWAQALAAALVARRISPNGISVVSIGFAAVAGVCLWQWSQWDGWLPIVLLVGAAVCIQLRLLCNMLDGMVAVEGGLRSPTGELFNEVPDRIADSLILVAAGYGIINLTGAVELGWGSALLAMFTAYIRAIGASVGLPGCFHGPMAKPHRMALMTLACLASAVCFHFVQVDFIMWTALGLVAAGSALTCVRRLRAIVLHLRSRQS